MSFLKSLVVRILHWAARRQVAVQHPFVIGVTGSVGKTSTKEAIGTVLTKTVKDREILIAPGSLNTEFGLPLVLLQLPKAEGAVQWAIRTMQSFVKGVAPPHKETPPVFVLEYGVQQAGDMKELLSIVKPDIAVVTNIGLVHFGSIKATAREKSQLVRALPKTGLAILNTQDKAVADMKKSTNADVIEVKGTARELAKTIAVEIAHHGFGVSKREAQRTLRNWQPPTGRLNLLKAQKNAWLLDDTYNANPQSVTHAVSELKRLGREKKVERSIAVLGDMLELGPEENKAHTGIALLAEKTADLVVLVGPRFRRTKRGNEWFAGPVAAAEYLQKVIKKGDMILVKGSESMRMEKVSEALLYKQLNPAKLLVRQTKYWKNKPYVAP